MKGAVHHWPLFTVKLMHACLCYCHFLFISCSAGHDAVLSDWCNFTAWQSDLLTNRQFSSFPLWNHFQDGLHEFPRLFTDTSEHIHFSIFSCHFFQFLVLCNLVSFWAHVKTSCIVSHPACTVSCFTDGLFSNAYTGHYKFHTDSRSRSHHIGHVLQRGVRDTLLPPRSVNKLVTYLHSAFSALILPSMLWRCWLGGRKDTRPVKNWAVGCWHGYLPGARCRLAYGPADAVATHCLLLQ